MNYKYNETEVKKKILLVLLERDDFHCSRDIIILFRSQMDYPLVGTASEVELWVSKAFDIGPVDKYVNVRKQH